MDWNKDIVLPDGRIAKSSRRAAHEAISVIKNEISGKQQGLLCRWSIINAYLPKYFRFGNSYVIAGGSGTGKSYLLNMLVNDFAFTKDIVLDDKTFTAINGNFEQPVLVLVYNYEMKSFDEKIRTVSSITGKSYTYYLQSEVEGISEDGKIIYNTLSEKDKKILMDLLNLNGYLSNTPVYYIEVPSNLDDWYLSVEFIGKQFPGYRKVVVLDHQLLSKPNGMSDNDMVKFAQRTGEIGTLIAKVQDSIVIILNQMNSEITKLDRVKFPNKHFPEMNDGYGGNGLYHAVDTYIFLNKPSAYGIELYSPLKYHTLLYVTEEMLEKYPKTFNKIDIGRILEVIHVLFHKNRFLGGGQDLFLLNQLYRGKFSTCPKGLLMTEKKE